MTNEKMFSDVKNFSYIFIPINWGICLIVTIILFICCEQEIPYGYILGSFTSYLTFGLLMKNTQSNLLPGKVSIKAKVVGGNIVRLAISFIILLVAYYNDNFNFFATFAGLLVIKVVLVFFVIIRHIVGKKEVKNDITL